MYADLMACHGDAQWRFYVEREFAGRDATGCADALNRMLREAGQRAISVNRSRGAMRNDAEANRLRAERGNNQLHRLKSKTERRSWAATSDRNRAEAVATPSPRSALRREIIAPTLAHPAVGAHARERVYRSSLILR